LITTKQERGHFAPSLNLAYFFWQQAAPASQQASPLAQQSLLAALVAVEQKSLLATGAALLQQLLFATGAALVQQPAASQQPQVHTQFSQVQLPVSQQKQPGAQQSQQPALEEDAGNRRPAKVIPVANTMIALSFINMGISLWHGLRTSHDCVNGI
jgi:hypothetical protein